MSRAKKPDPKCGLVQPYEPPELSEDLINDLQNIYLGVSDAEMSKVKAHIEHQLGAYRADLISLDKAPTLASIQAEVEPVLSLANKLSDALEALTTSSLSALNMKSLEGGTPVDEAMLSLARLREASKSVIFDSKKESRGGSNRQVARHVLILGLADIYRKFAVNRNTNEVYDFILEILENQVILEMDIRKIKELLKPA